MEVLGEVTGQNQEEAWVRRESSGFQPQLIPRAEGWSGTQDLGSKPQGQTSGPAWPPPHPRRKKWQQGAWLWASH